MQKCAWCHLKLRCKLSAWKVRHDCTQNISKECSNKQWSLDATVPQNVETFFIATNALCLENHCKSSMTSTKQILYHLWKSIHEDFSTHAESLIYMRRQQQERQHIHWEHAHIENLSRNQLDFCKINYQYFMKYSIQRLFNICSL